MKSQMKWDQQALEAWLEESAQKDEDALTLKKYAKEDESKIKDLTLKLEKYVLDAQKQKKLVDDETLNTITIQLELDKTADEFRKTHRERQDLIRQWENIIDQMQKRDSQIEQSAQVNFKSNKFKNQFLNYLNLELNENEYRFTTWTRRAGKKEKFFRRSTKHELQTRKRY